MTSKRKLLITITLVSIFALVTTFFVGVRAGAKQEYLKGSLFSAFKVMRDLEALRASQVENSEIKVLIQEKETDLDFHLASVPTYQTNGLYWLDFVLAKSNDAVFLRSIADYRQRYPSKPQSFKYLSSEQQAFYLKVYAETLKKQKLLLEKYR